ncbi:tetratricopeptide repeat protein [Paenibacillus hodogayensis]|uniref:Tetratricopeptide repeat protein n=1 Tax=Paenibacillus hodogayensis TaxID=279208 RepID=A0ABV5W4K4_9BACL
MDGEDEIKQAYASILDADFERAIDWFEQAVRVDPDNADYHYKLSVTYARSNRLDKAIKHARLACKLQADHDVYRLHADAVEARLLVRDAGTQWDDSRQLYRAVEQLKQAVCLDPLLTEAYLLLAIAYGEQGQYELALQAAKDAVKLEPQNAQANRLAGRYRAKLKRYLRS